jgi:hypothetical protein
VQHCVQEKKLKHTDSYSIALPRVNSVVLKMGSADPFGGPWIYFRGSVNLDGEKITTSFSLTCNWNIAVPSLQNGGKKVIYGH